MRFFIELHPRALEEIELSKQWYEDHLPGLGDRFIKSIDLKLKDISNSPEHYSKKRINFCEAQIYNFPFLIIYEIWDDIIIVHSVFHTSRNPAKKPSKRK